MLGPDSNDLRVDYCVLLENIGPDPRGFDDVIVAVLLAEKM